MTAPSSRDQDVLVEFHQILSAGGDSMTLPDPSEVVVNHLNKKQAMGQVDVVLILVEKSVRDLPRTARSFLLSYLYTFLSSYINVKGPSCVCLPLLTTSYHRDRLLTSLSDSRTKDTTSEDSSFLSLILEFLRMYIPDHSKLIMNPEITPIPSKSENPSWFYSGTDDGLPVQIPDTISDQTLFAGTYDRLHAGHIFLLSAAHFAHDSSDSALCTISVTHGDLLKGKALQEMVEPYEIRAKRVVLLFRLLSMATRFEDSHNCNLDVIPLEDPVGVAIEPRFAHKTLIVTSDTLRGARYVNQCRANKGLDPMEVWCVPELGIKEGVKLSSSQLRREALERRMHSVL